MNATQASIRILPSFGIPCQQEIHDIKAKHAR